MNLIVVFKQREEQYTEQYAPEIVAVCTEYELDDGAGDWLRKQEEEAKKEPGIVAVKRFRFLFGDEVRVQIRQALIGDVEIAAEKCKGVEEIKE